MGEKVQPRARSFPAGPGLLMVWGLALIVGDAGLADDTLIGSIGGQLVPLNSEHIRMVSEKVQVKLGARGGLVRCQFVFRNEGPATRVKVGFPQKLGQAPLQGFRCTVDGKPVRVRSELTKKKGQTYTQREHPYDGWHWWWMHFGRDETKTVENRYRVESSHSSSGNHWFRYVLKTGATWKGPIGHAEVEIDERRVPGSGVYKIMPPGYLRQGGKIRWNWTDFEPEEDIHLEWNPDPRLWVGATGFEGVSFSAHLPAQQCLLQGRVYVPLVRLAEALKIRCDPEGKPKIRVVQGTPGSPSGQIVFQVGSREVRIRSTDGNEETRLLPAPVFQLNGETMVPLRVLAEALGWELTFKSGASNFGNYGVEIRPGKQGRG